MNAELRHHIEARLEAEGLLEKTVAGVVLAACDGRDALERYLNDGDAAHRVTPVTHATPADAYLTSITVEGFRGIGNKQTLNVAPGPGLTLVVGRNGSGKSSFAEALEVLFTGDNKRWADRPKVWKEGWRNLHHPHPATISAELLLADLGPTTVTAQWDEGAPVDAATTIVQPKAHKKTSLDRLGWDDALVSYRPFLSYNELGSMFDEGPSKLYDALSQVLGLEDLVLAQSTLSKARTERLKAMKDIGERCQTLLRELSALRDSDDERADAAIAALHRKDWGFDALDALLAASTPSRADGLVAALQQASMLDVPDFDDAFSFVGTLRKAEVVLQALASTDAERSRKLAALLDAALGFHENHPGDDCPVCGTAGVLGDAWVDHARAEVADLKAKAEESERLHRLADVARATVVRALQVKPPSYLQSLATANVGGAAGVLEAWQAWSRGALLTTLSALADHVEAHYETLKQYVEIVGASAAHQLAERQDRWRPVATALAAWIPAARRAVRERDDITFIEEAEQWLKKASADIRNEAFAPIADNAMAIWRLLRQNSNVELGQVQLIGGGTSRRVSLDVTVDGVEGAALGVMSQGELHSLALSLFLPRAMLEDSPFRFIVIDDPVQSMDPARVDGLARVLDDVARTRQVIVLTHDDRFYEAVRRLGIAATTFNVTRRPGSLVEIRRAMDPVKAHIDDAQALAFTADLPPDVLKRVIPGFCRAAIEAACMQVARRRRLAAGQSHRDVEETLATSATLTTRAALALFDDASRGADVLSRLNQFGAWAADAFVQSNKGAHGQVTVDPRQLIKDTEDLCEHILNIK